MISASHVWCLCVRMISASHVVLMCAHDFCFSRGAYDFSRGPLSTTCGTNCLESESESGNHAPSQGGWGGSALTKLGRSSRATEKKDPPARLSQFKAGRKIPRQGSPSLKQNFSRDYFVTWSISTTCAYFPSLFSKQKIDYFSRGPISTTWEFLFSRAWKRIQSCVQVSGCGSQGHMSSWLHLSGFHASPSKTTGNTSSS